MKKENSSELYLEDKEVHKLALEQLVKYMGLDLSGKESSDEEIWEIILQAAAKQTSIEQVCKTSEVAPSGNTVRGIIREQLDLEDVDSRTNEMLAGKLPKRLKKRQHHTALDLVLIPYHGEAESKPSEIVRSQAKDGTTHFHAYATAFIVDRGRRYTLALTYVRSTDELIEIVKRLAERVKGLGIRVKCWLLDREFYTVAVIRDLKKRHQRAIIPVIIRGKKNPPGGSRTLVQGKTSYLTEYTMRSQKHGEVSFPVAVAAKNWAGRAKKHGRKPLAFVVLGMKTDPLAIAAIYKKRFGIETSHRQMHQGRARTSSPSPVLRFLYVAIAFLLRNLWAWLHWAVVAEPNRGGRRLRPSVFSLEQMLNWIARISEEQLLTVTKLKVGYSL